ncbi:winged helix-turn-helix transcriptional regulator [Halovenus sp. WSH3]|uniref:Winged helix-turn-helix transcriptional regulator n=1 Tax=Halovenus carboxidivorans TaxID=2692199 RepID=A0A6B0T913_9EURY|nr:helix-turn-helix domain-containing protein [Halovenus carboxidivorans]MXR51350.1 winged helix-turn-helix transcriptional regulator [Halovenus carboxidivorans]
MSADDTPDDDHDADGARQDGSGDMREKLEAEADRAIEQFDEGVVDLLSWILETETRARIYIHLRQHPNSTSDEIAEGTGLYPSTVREALAALHEDDTVQRSKRESDGAGNNPYEYSAVPPSDLIGGIVDDVQEHMNAVFNLDQYLDGDGTDDEPIRITVTEEGDDAEDDGAET